MKTMKTYKQLFEINTNEIFAFVEIISDDFFTIIINDDLLKNHLVIGDGIDNIEEEANELIIHFDVDTNADIYLENWNFLDKKYKEINDNINFLNNIMIIPNQLKIILEFDGMIDSRMIDGFEFLSSSDFKKKQKSKQFNL